MNYNMIYEYTINFVEQHQRPACGAALIPGGLQYSDWFVQV